MPRRIAWFRFYSEVLHDPKVQRLTGNEFKAWVNLLCLANETEPRGTLPFADADIGFALRISAHAAGQLVARFHEWGFVELDTVNRVMTIHGWDKRQYESDDVTLRVRKHRETRNGHETFQETPAKQKETLSDTEQNRTDPETEEEMREDAPTPILLKSSKKCLSEEDLQRIQEAWPLVNVADLAEEFRDYVQQHPRKYVDWPLTLNGWARRRTREQDAAVQRHTPGRNAVGGESKIADWAKRNSVPVG